MSCKSSKRKPGHKARACQACHALRCCSQACTGMHHDVSREQADLLVKGCTGLLTRHSQQPLTNIGAQIPQPDLPVLHQANHSVVALRGFRSHMKQPIHRTDTTSFKCKCTSRHAKTHLVPQTPSTCAEGNKYCHDHQCKPPDLALCDMQADQPADCTLPLHDACFVRQSSGFMTREGDIASTCCLRRGRK